MKTINKLFLILLAVAVSSCGNDWLDLEPSNAVSTEKSIESIGDAQASIVGLYSLWSGPYSHGGRLTYYGDAAGDDMRANGSTKRVASVYSYKFTAQSVASSYWSQPYTVIKNANNILAIIDELEVAPNDKPMKDYVKGQALMFRAWSHFDLALLFGTTYLKNGGTSPAATVAVTKIATDAKPSRNTVKEMYDVAIADLIAAIPLLKTKASETQGQFNALSAQLLLSRIYLYSGKYQEAYASAKAVIDAAPAAGFALCTQAEYQSGAMWKARYRSEGLFELAFGSTNQSDNECIPFLMNDNSDGYDDMVFTQSFLDSFDPADIRKASISKKVGSTNYCVKYAGPTGKVREANVMLLRLTEAYLNAAEASVHLTDAAIKAQGLVYYNAIHTRAGLPQVTAAITIDDVLLERRYELVGEGHRMFDLIRNNKKIERIGTDHLAEVADMFENKTLDWNNYRVVLPIPEAERNANDNIGQNDGY